MVTVWKVQQEDRVIWVTTRRDAEELREQCPKSNISKHEFEDDVWDSFVELVATDVNVH